MTMAWPMAAGMLLLWLLVIAAVAVGAYLLVRAVRTRGGADDRGGLTILEQRYARGEIDHEEFERRREGLASRR